MILAGGTGGHVMPALVVAKELRAREVRVIWLGTRSGLEAKLVKVEGFEFHSIYIKSWRGWNPLRLLLMPFILTIALLQTLCLVAWFRPHSVLSMGGFVAGPGGLIAKLLQCPLVVHEQNTVVGKTNKHLSKYGVRILSGFPKVSGLQNNKFVGNPVRNEIFKIEPIPRDKSELRILVIGGSQGAQIFNDTLPELLGEGWQIKKRNESPELPRISIWHQCGNVSAAKIRERYFSYGIGGEINAFIGDMAKAYAWCDLVVCRAGALTLAEICASGSASILVPYPHAASDHQFYNGTYLYHRRAAHLITQEEFVKGDWLEDLKEFVEKPDKLKEMRFAAKKLARDDAANLVADACLEAMDA